MWYSLLNYFVSLSLYSSSTLYIRTAPCSCNKNWNVLNWTLLVVFIWSHTKAKHHLQYDIILKLNFHESTTRKKTWLWIEGLLTEITDVWNLDNNKCISCASNNRFASLFRWDWINGWCSYIFATYRFKPEHVYTIVGGKSGRPAKPALFDQLWVSVIDKRTKNVIAPTEIRTRGCCRCRACDSESAL